jgi:Flp pilus assembly pilin Flp
MMIRTRQRLNNLLKDGRKADAVEYALVASVIALAAVAIEISVLIKIGNEFNMITNKLKF